MHRVVRVLRVIAEVQQVDISDAMLSEVRQNVLTALNVSKDGRIELAEFARSVSIFTLSAPHFV